MRNCSQMKVMAKQFKVLEGKMFSVMRMEGKKDSNAGMEWKTKAFVVTKIISSLYHRDELTYVDPPSPYI